MPLSEAAARVRKSLPVLRRVRRSFPRTPLASAHCAPNWPSRASPASSFRAPTSIRTNMCPANAERLRWLTGFAGSAGIAVVLKDAAALFVDGRYTAQVKTQADGSVFEFRHVVDEPPTEWIAKKPQAGRQAWL